MLNNIVKSNQLIETSYKLGSREQFFILFLISRIPQNETEFREYRIHHKDIAQIMNFDGRRRVANKEDIFKMMNNLNRQPIRFTEGDEDVQVVWITSLRYNKKTGEYTFTFSKDLKPFLLQLKEHFTLFNISNVVYLSGHSTRIYEVLKRYHYKKEPVVFTIQDLKFWLHIEDKYPEYYEFKRWVLEPSRIELEKYTDLRFTYTEGDKDGKKVLSLEFTTYDNEPQENPTSLNILTNIGERLGLSAPKDGVGEKTSAETKPTVSTAKKQKLEALTWAQNRAYLFLIEKGVNGTFVTDSIFTHPKVKYEPLQGFEDLYFRAMWQFFESKSKSKEKAGTFVNWFKNGKLTEDSLHANLTEGIIEKRKSMPNKELEMRLKSKSMTNTAMETYLEQQKNTPVQPHQLFKNETKATSKADIAKSVNTALKKVSKVAAKFDIEFFKKQNPTQYAAFIEKATSDYEQFYQQAGSHSFDAHRNKESIEHRAKEYSEEWSKANVK